MKIMMIITGLKVGGAETQVVGLSKKIQDLGHEVSIVCLTNANEFESETKNIKTTLIDTKKNPLSLIKSFLQLKSIVEKEKPDIIHAHMIHANIICRLLKIFSKNARKIISTAHSNNEGGYLRNLAYRITDHLSDLNTHVSKNALDLYIQKKIFSPEKSIVTYNGIDFSKFKTNLNTRKNLREKLSIEQKKVFISIGRLAPEKNHTLLLKSFKDLMKSRNDLYLIIVGDGPDAENLKTYAFENEMAHNIHFTGSIKNVEDYLCASDYFVLTSLWEGFSLVTAEAMAMRNLVVATDCGGVSEVMGGHGILVQNNSIQHLKKGMMELIEMNEDDYKNKSLEAQKHVEDKFNLSKISSVWIKNYKKLLK